jgi:23S rRNA pseudouridine2605 synthase
MTSELSDGGGVRLQKVLSRAGVASRRGAEVLIADGRVTVDGETVTRQGRRVDPDAVVVAVDGVRIAVHTGRTYLALNKPRGVHSTMSDQRGRECVGDLVGERRRTVPALFHVGRLDAETEGLLLLTDDGELGHRLMHPAYQVAKTYLAEVAGPLPRDLGSRLRSGVELDEGPVRLDAFRVLHVAGDRAMVELVLHEGRNRVVRRTMAAVGHPVKRLARTSVGPVRLGQAASGSVRELSSEEIGALQSAVGL